MPQRHRMTIPERAFEAYVERALSCGVLDQGGINVLRQGISTLAGDEREERIIAILQDGHRGVECEVIGITGRHPLGWFGDGSTARVPPNDDNARTLAPGTLSRAMLSYRAQLADLVRSRMSPSST